MISRGIFIRIYIDFVIFTPTGSWNWNMILKIKNVVATTHHNMNLDPWYATRCNCGETLMNRSDASPICGLCKQDDLCGRDACFIPPPVIPFMITHVLLLSSYGKEKNNLREYEKLNGHLFILSVQRNEQNETKIAQSLNSSCRTTKRNWLLLLLFRERFKEKRRIILNENWTITTWGKYNHRNI